MNKSKKLTKSLLFVATILLLVFASCFSFTGSWFTSNKKFNGTIEVPVIKPTIVYEYATNDYRTFNGSYLVSSSDNWATVDNNKAIYIKFDSSNTVKLQIVRVVINVEWGTNDSGFELAVLPPIKSLALNPNYTNHWVAGQNTLNAGGIIDEWQTREGLLDADIEALGGRSEIINTIGDSFTVSSKQYYYDAIVDLDSLTNGVLKVCNGFTFDSTHFNASEYADLTAKISISVEAESVSQRVIGTTGYWITDENRPTDAWVSSILG